VRHKIAVLIAYFGNWPEWMNFFVESCRANRSIDWFIFGDSDPPENRAANVHHMRIGFDDYVALLSDRLGQPLNITRPYKLCDYKPTLAFVHRDLVASYDFVGFGDIDVIYGDLRAFHDDETLSRYDVLSTHRDRVSGHYCLMRNTPEVTMAFRKARGWKACVASADYTCFDERAMYNYLKGNRSRLLPAKAPGISCLFQETHSTPGVTDSMRWYWQDGQLTNEFYPAHPFMYLHFMSWQSNRWYESQPNALPGAEAPWSKLPAIVGMDWRQARKHGFTISPSGIEPIGGG